MNISTQAQQTMLSTEIAELTGKLHKNVMRDIDVIIEQLTSSNLSWSVKPREYKAGNGQMQPCYELDHEATMVVVTGYDVVARTKVIKRWLELESEVHKQLTANEILAQSALALVEHDRRLDSAETEIKHISAQVADLQVDLRNGVPHGYVSKANALRQYGRGLSKAIFEAVMTEFDVKTQSYVHYAEGHSVATFGYLENVIPDVIEKFISSLEQVTTNQCFSEKLNKRLNYKKPTLQ